MEKPASTRQLKVAREIQKDLAEMIRSKGMAAFGVSDKLYEYKWETCFGQREIHRTLEVLFEAAKKALK